MRMRRSQGERFYNGSVTAEERIRSVDAVRG